jgi:uncharacterized membrane protein YdjX (TVP38/TMEM64 family)/copper chaperone CopZ
MTGSSRGSWQTPRRGTWLRLGLLAAALAAASWLLWLLVKPAVGEFSPASISARVESAGLWGPVVSVALMVVHTLVPFPAELLAAANGLAFGAVEGTLVTWLGGLAGAASGYAVGWLLERWLMRHTRYAELMERARHLIERHGTTGLLVVRLLPVIPFNLVDYAAGALRLSWWKFSWTTAVGILPWSALMTVGGTQVLPAVRGEVAALVLLAGLGALLVGAIWLGHRHFRPRAAVASRPARPGVMDETSTGDHDVITRLAVTGMTCELCARKVTVALGAEAGVHHVQVALEDGEVWVRFDPHSTGPHRLCDVVRGHGFAAETASSGRLAGRGTAAESRP